jgi:phosphate transport system substrate-binding protein
MSRSLFLLVLALVCALPLGCGGGGGGGVPRLNGAGSSFVAPMMDQWSKTYHQDTGVEVNYQSKGSSAGIEQMTDKSVDFGCSDAPMNERELDKARSAGGEVLHIPLVMGAAVPAYNLEGVDDLRFTGPVLADIYMRKVTKWNDPALTSINPGVKLPDKEIKVVHRSDGSGTTYMWTEYLSKVRPEWEKKLHFGTSVNWPEGTIGEKGTEGVAKNVSSTPGAIGYIEQFYAIKNHIKFGPRSSIRSSVFTITHNLGTKNVLCTVYDGSDKEVICDILTGTTNSLTVTFTVAPVTASTWRVVVIG